MPCQPMYSFGFIIVSPYKAVKVRNCKKVQPSFVLCLFYAQTRVSQISVPDLHVVDRCQYRISLV